MPASNELRVFYMSLAAEADLQTLIDDHVKEDIHLEFKQKKDRSSGQLDDQDKFQFSRALSGFANSDGGVLVWGIETDKHERASKRKPITDVATFFAALKKSILHATQPVVDDILLEVIPTPTSASDGYVRCLIPSSDKTPHRAMLAGREYYKRTAEGFYRLEHFDLEDMFGRRPVPRLAIGAEVKRGGGTSGTGGRTQDVRVELTVRNEGRGTARAPFVEVLASPQYNVKPLNISSGATDALLHWLEVGTGHSRFLGRADFVIHPTLDFVFAVVTRRFTEHGDRGGDLLLRCRLAAENDQLREITFAWPATELLRAIGWA